ncbi:MAG: transcription elongation factor GreA [Bacteroidetes bacterium]|nr:transcription elongation factor GreA [Bacteroidota bacterium]
MSETVYFTKEGLDKLKADLERLTGVERRRITKEIAIARDKGDLSENAEYDAAKEAQGMLELKIKKLQSAVGSARVIDKSKIDTSKVTILAKVKILNHKMKKEFTYELVSENEADLKKMKISVQSPIGSSLLGKEVGDKVDVKTPGGVMTLEIIDISV